MYRRAVITAAVLFAGTALAQSSTIQPGMWEATITTSGIEMPGAPPQAAAMMGNRPPVTVRRCVTPEQAASPQALLAAKKSCRFPRYVLAGGRVDAEMVCEEGGGTMHATSTGSYTPISYDVTTRMASSAPGMTMTMTSHAVGHRVGAC